MGSFDTESGQDQDQRRKSISVLSNIGIAFTILSIPASLLPFLSFGLQTGGPQGMLITWPIVSFASFFVGLSMAEIVSAFPTSGGLYFWSSKLCSSSWAPFVSYLTGWLNFLGLWGTSSGTIFDIGELFVSYLYVSGALNREDFPSDGATYKWLVMIVCFLGVVACGWVNTLPPRVLDVLGQVCLFLNISGIFINVFGTALLGSGPRTSVKDLFQLWENETGFSDTYVWMIGILPAATLYTGYDSTGHFTEETQGAAMSAPLAIMSAILLAFPVGWLTLWGLLCPIPPSAYQAFSSNPASTSTVVDIFVYTQGTWGGSFQTMILILMTLTCSYALIATHMRMAYTFSRDGGLPGSSFLYKLDENGIPVRALWTVVALDFLILLPSLYSERLYEAINSIGTVGTYLAYSIPIGLKVFHCKDFVPGPFSLGVLSFPIGLISLLWLLFASFALMLPTLNIQWSPEIYASYQDFLLDFVSNVNWSPVMVAMVLCFAGLSWVCHARSTFTGPVTKADFHDFDVAEFKTKLDSDPFHEPFD